MFVCFGGCCCFLISVWAKELISPLQQPDCLCNPQAKDNHWTQASSCLLPCDSIQVTSIFHLGVKKEEEELIGKQSELGLTLRPSFVFPYASQNYSKPERKCAHTKWGMQRTENGCGYKNMLDNVWHLESFLLFILPYWDIPSILIYEILYLENVLVNLL